MAAWIRFVLFVCLASVLLGCNSTNSVDYQAGHSTLVRPAPASGLCELYCDGSPSLARTIVKGEPIGFEKTNGRLVAVAGPNQIFLPEGNYRWRIRPAQDDGRPARQPALVAALLALGISLEFFPWLLFFRHVH